MKSDNRHFNENNDSVLTAAVEEAKINKKESGNYNLRRTRIVGKGGLWVTSFIYKYKTSTTYPLFETMQYFVLIIK